MKRIFQILLLCLAVGPASAAPETPFERANHQFEAGKFQVAADIYREVLDQDGASAAVLFNLGNCEQRLGRYGPAILAYERARLLAPRDPDIAANLGLARKAATVFEESGRYPRLDAFFSYLSLNEWSWLVAGSGLLLGGLAVLRGGWRLGKRWMVVGTRATAGLAVVCILAGAGALYLRHGERNRGIVLTDNAVVRLSPFEKAESLGTAGSGRIVHLHETKDGFHYVQVPGTELRGWMSAKDVGAIEGR